tara:strand:- start:122 stop:922 length:801 start_codon:yes stop_codon:yes gene_type:complete
MSDNDSFYSISGTESNGEEEYQESNLSLLLLAYMMINTKFYNIYLFKQGRDFIDNIITWTYNNPLDINHVKSIKKQVMESPFLTGVFSVVKLQNDKVYLIDGHHRHQALKELYTEGKLEEDIPLEIHCYESDTIKSDNTLELFYKLNHTKPFKVGEEITIMTIRIIDYIEEKHPGIIRDISRKRFPFIRKKTLNDSIQNRLKITKDFSYDRIIYRIEKENTSYQKKAEVNVKKLKQKWDTAYPVFKRTGCYLGLVEVDTWVSNVIG